MKEYRTTRSFALTEEGVFVSGPEVLLLTCKVTDKSPEAVEFTPVADEFSSFPCWVRIAELSPLVQNKVLSGHGSAVTLGFTFVFDGGCFIGLPTIVDKDKEITCFPSKEAALSPVTD